MAPNSPQRLEAILNDCASGPSGIILYNRDGSSEYLSYNSLRSSAVDKAHQLQHHFGVVPGRVILVHFSTHRENILWFWATILAGCVPAMSTPFVNNQEGRASHLAHLHELLLEPLVVTSRELLKTDFGNNTSLRCVAAEDVESSSLKKNDKYTNVSSASNFTHRVVHDACNVGSTIEKSVSLQDVAALMLTSGSTGAAKAVCLTHEQILAACNGKLSHLPLPKDPVILNWIGLNHVGSLTELHLTAMVAGCDQVHVPTADVIADPLLLLRLLSRHQVARTFAPNFMLAKLDQVLDDAQGPDTEDIDLRALLCLITGGEPNGVDTCVRLSKHLQRLGAPSNNTITPGFGMTETCAGSTYNQACPSDDVQAQSEFTALGTAVPGLQMRISEGNLEISGPVVFQRYFNNTEATEAAFTPDGWFKTGDLATIDDLGTLRFIGRKKDFIIINGVKYLPHELETCIDRARIPGVATSGVVCFAYRPEGAATEQIQVIYEHEYDALNGKARVAALHVIISTVLSFAGARPRVLPLAPGRLERSTLGKLSHSKVKSSLLSGQYQQDIDVDEHILQDTEVNHAAEALHATEQRLLQVFIDLNLGTPEMGVDLPILDTGITSVDLIRIKRAAEIEFAVPNIPIITLMTNTTISTLAAAIERMQTSQIAAP